MNMHSNHVSVWVCDNSAIRGSAQRNASLIVTLSDNTHLVILMLENVTTCALNRGPSTWISSPRFLAGKDARRCIECLTVTFNAPLMEPCPPPDAKNSSRRLNVEVRTCVDAPVLSLR